MLEPILVHHLHFVCSLPTFGLDGLNKRIPITLLFTPSSSFLSTSHSCSPPWVLMKLWTSWRETSWPPLLLLLSRLQSSVPLLLLRRRYTPRLTSGSHDGTGSRVHTHNSSLVSPSQSPADAALDALAGDFVSSSAAPAVKSACAPAEAVTRARSHWNV